jgi:hypothetical protein
MIADRVPQANITSSLPAAIAPAVETESGENSAFVTVKVDKAIVAVHIQGRGTEDNEKNDGDTEEEHDRKNHRMAVNLADQAAFLQYESAVSAHTGAV